MKSGPRNTDWYDLKGNMEKYLSDYKNLSDYKFPSSNSIPLNKMFYLFIIISLWVINTTQVLQMEIRAIFSWTMCN